ncbi:MAG: hypothetical protein JWM19_6772, partial [Actinomycetia bacterium]|nr:hypothetical protein [Actinomycetes bacterium]
MTTARPARAAHAACSQPPSALRGDPVPPNMRYDAANRVP